MTREEAKKYLPYIQAFSEGKAIQIQVITNNGSKIKWEDINEPNFRLGRIYRVKPEPKYRPFTSKEECWNEMLKHEPFGWITNGISNHNIRGIDNITVMSGDYYDYMQAFKNLKFIDGQPFGVKTE